MRTSGRDVDKPTITVLTLHTPGRHEITDCVRSVAAQDVAADIAHLVVVDGEADAAPDKALYTLAKDYRFATRYLSGVPASLPPKDRVPRLRQAALRLVTSTWLAWLDDDNWWEPHHLSSLLAVTAQHPHALPYSFRRLWTRDGHPYCLDRNPWQSGREQELAHRAYLETEGIRAPGSPLMYDTVFSAPIGPYAGTIDLGEWLFPTSVAQCFGIPQPRSDEAFWEDDLLLWQIVRSRRPLIPTHQFTLNYRVGGVTSSLA